MDEYLKNKLLNQIHCDFLPYSEIGINSQHIAKIRSYLKNGDNVLSLPKCSHTFSVLEIQISDNLINCSNLRDLHDIKNQDFTRYYRGKCLIKMLEQTAQHFCLPDLEIYISVEDHFIIDELPLLVMAKPPNSNAILCPPYTFAGFEDFKNPSWESFQAIILKKNINWKDRQEVFFFRGSNNHWSRNLLAKQDSHIFDVDLLSSSHDPNSKEFVPLESHYKFRYLLDLPGWLPYTLRHNHLLMTGSLVHKIETWEPYKLFFSNCVEPWIHYIPISVYNFPIEQKPSALLDFINRQYLWNQANDLSCQQIAYEGQKQMAKLTLEMVNWYWHELFWSYSHAQTWATRSHKSIDVHLDFILPLQMRKNNFLICPSLEQPIEKIYELFVYILIQLIQAPRPDSFTLIIYIQKNDIEIMEECLGEALLSALWQCSPVIQEPKITFLSNLISSQWEAIQPYLNGQIILSEDNKLLSEIICLNLPKISCENLANFY